MLNLAKDTVAEIIILARELERARPEFEAFVGAMPSDQQAELVALMWIGRGTFDADDWQEAVDTAIAEATVPTATYLMGSPHLADHLENGLDALGVAARNEEDELY